MEHIRDWLVVLTKALHFPFIVGIHISLKKQVKSNFSDIGDINIGDNLPYVFLSERNRLEK